MEKEREELERMVRGELEREKRKRKKRERAARRRWYSKNGLAS